MSPKTIEIITKGVIIKEQEEREEQAQRMRIIQEEEEAKSNLIEEIKDFFKDLPKGKVFKFETKKHKLVYLEGFDPYDRLLDHNFDYSGIEVMVLIDFHAPNNIQVNINGVTSVGYQPPSYIPISTWSKKDIDIMYMKLEWFEEELLRRYSK